MGIRRLQPLHLLPGHREKIVCAELVYRGIWNVVSSALNYSTDNGLVESTADGRDDDSLNVLIANAGPHVHEDDVVGIFLPFRRLHTEPGLTGYGLGLAIAGSAIAAHDGALDAWSHLMADPPSLSEFPAADWVAMVREGRDHANLSMHTVTSRSASRC